MLFGAPEDVAARHTLTFKQHTFMAGWLRCAEALMRRLLLIEASVYPKPNTRPLLKPRRARVRKLMAFEAEHPENWRVSFRCFAAPRRQRSPAPRAKKREALISITGEKISKRKDPWHQAHWKPVTFRSAWPLAERYEALIRTFNDPAAAARRLVRRLYATPHRGVELMKAPPEAEARVDRFAEAGEAAAHAWAAHFSSA